MEVEYYAQVQVLEEEGALVLQLEKRRVVEEEEVVVVVVVVEMVVNFSCQQGKIETSKRLMVAMDVTKSHYFAY